MNQINLVRCHSDQFLVPPDRNEDNRVGDCTEDGENDHRYADDEVGLKYYKYPTSIFIIFTLNIVF